MDGVTATSLFYGLRQRELFGGQVECRPFVQEFSSEGECSGTIFCNASTARAAPVFGLQYGSTYNKFLAAADEEGFISIINTAQALPATLDDDVSASRPVAQWTAHRNAIFDVRWANSDRWIYTASGDMTVGLWDTSYAYKIASFYGHSGSVKTLSVCPTAAELFVTGSCDGNLLVWDSRVNVSGMNTSSDAPGPPRQAIPLRQPVLRLKEPHARADIPDASSSSSSARRKGALSNRLPPTVTATTFLEGGTGHVVASGGVDGLVKFWDLRYTIFPTKTVSVPGSDVMDSISSSIQLTNANARMVHLSDTTLPQLGRRTYAVVSMALRPGASQLLVSLTGGHHLLYDVDRPEIGPVRWYGGHTVSSFYVKTAFSPDGSHFASGSSDDRVCIWQVDDPDGGAPYSLEGHEAEVTTVAWCPTDFCQLATAGDDFTVKVWNIKREQREERKNAPGGWVPRCPRADVHLAQKPQIRQELPRSIDNNDSLEEAMEDSATIAIATTPAPAAAVGASRLFRATTGPSATRPAPPSTKMRVANALRQSLIQHTKVRRTKQQTLAEALTRAVVLGRADDRGASSTKKPRSGASGGSKIEQDALSSPSSSSDCQAKGGVSRKTEENLSHNIS